MRRSDCYLGRLRSLQSLQDCTVPAEVVLQFQLSVIFSFSSMKWSRDSVEFFCALIP